MAYNTPETVADYLARFQMEITHRGKGTFTPDHVKYSLTIASGGKDFFTTFESNPHVHGEPTITQVFGALASERAARYAYDHPKLPKGFVTIEQLQGDLDLGDLRDEVEDFDFDGDITEAFGETAEYKVDDNYHALLTWLPDHTEWLEEAESDGLLEGCKGDIDPEAVSVDSEAHDMENGRDGLDGNAPEKDAPEKDDRDAQPPVDTDNR